MDIEISPVGRISFVRSRRAKRLRITIRPDKTITATFPLRVSLEQAKQFVQSKTGWIQKHLQQPEPLVCPDADISAEELDKVQDVLFERLRFFASKYNFAYNRATFRCQKTKWGSCSSKNHINLNINLVFLPSHLQDYVLLHELVHTKHKNHGKHFWTELDEYTEGRTKAWRKELRQCKMKLQV
jgi:predicted metal-dependent hydrolase